MTLACALLLAGQSHFTFAQSGAAAPAGELRQASFPFGVDPAKRCPELRQTNAEAGAVAVIQFVVGPTGVPSKASVRESSGSESFDAAARSCVLKLHFLPATRIGDAVAIESWQQLALKSPRVASAPQAAHCDEAGAAHASDTGSSAVVADVQDINERKRPGPTNASAGVCVCVDANGKLTQPPVLMNSSGIAGFDKAALELSSAAHYRPAVSSSGQPTPGCFRFKIGVDVD